MPTDDQLLGIDPSAWPVSPEVEESSKSFGSRPRRSNNCIRGTVRRRTLRGSPTFAALKIGNLKRYLVENEAERAAIDNVLFGAKNSAGSGNNNGYSSDQSKSSEISRNIPRTGGSRLVNDLLLIAQLRARFPKAMRSLETVVREFKALDSLHSPLHSDGHQGDVV